MEQRSICLINDSFPPVTDGVANAVVNYAKNLTQDGKRATVVTPAYPDADDTQFGFPVVRYPSVDLTKLVGYHAGLPFSSQTLEKLVEQRFDLIHCHCPVTSAMLARALRDRIHVPLVFTYHTKFDIDIANAIKGKLLQEEAKKVLVDNGVPLGKVDDEEVRLAYTGTTDEETIVMAEEFRNDCLGNMKLYTDRFMLDEESGRWWRLRDPDMAAAGAMAAPDIIDYMREF